VFNGQSGSPISGVQVSVGAATVTTSASGGYFLGNAPTGSVVINFSKAGYYPVSYSFTVSPNAVIVLNASLYSITSGSGTAPVVVEAHSAFAAPAQHVYFLDGVSLNQTFTTTVDWRGHPPGQVQFFTPRGTFPAAGSGNSWNRTLDMGTDVGPVGSVTVVATAGDGASSAPYIANLKVVPPPPIFEFIPAAYFLHDSDSIHNTVEYRVLGLEGASLGLAPWSAASIDASFPLFGGAEMKIGMDFDPPPLTDVSARLEAKVTGDGKADLFSLGFDTQTHTTVRRGVRCRKGIKLPFLEVSPSVAVAFGYRWDDALNQWTRAGELDVDVNVLWSSPQIPFVVPVIPIPLYFRTDNSLLLQLQLSLANESSQCLPLVGQFEFEPLVRGVVGAGVAQLAAVEGYLGGGFHAGYEFTQQGCDWLSPYVILVGGVQAILGPWTIGPVELRYTWPNQVADLAGGQGELLQAPSWHLLPRDYVARASLPRARDNGPDAPIALGVFPYSVPQVVRSNNDMLAVWIADDPTRGLINRTELTFARFVSGVWAASAPVANDGTADLNPQLVSVPGGDAVCIWQDSNAVLSDQDSFATFLSHLEVAVSTFDHTTGTWSAPTRLSNNTDFDRSPRIAAASATDMLAVWIENPANDLWGSATAPNEIRWAMKSGTGWSTPQVAASGLGLITDTALAYNGTNGVFVYVLDADGDLNTPDDQELWEISFSGGFWTGPIQLTNDAVADTSPKLVFDGLSDLHLAWLKGDDIRYANGTDVAGADIVVSPKASMGSRDFDLVMGANNTIAVVWNDASTAGLDLWTSFHDPVLDSWSQPRQLTEDDSAERFIRGAFDANGDLFCVYDKTTTVYTDRKETVNGQLVVVKNVPSAGASDLFYLSYQLRGDLSVASSEVTVDPPNPAPTTNATITVIVRNLGEAPASNVEIAVYDGNPSVGGTLIGQVTLPGVVAGGDSTITTMAWGVSNSLASHILYAIVDPAQVQSDRDRNNNTAVVPGIVSPDVEIDSILVQNAGPRDRSITVRLSNTGTLPINSTTVTLRRDSVTGSVMTTLSNPQVIPSGAFNDLTWMWHNPPLDSTSVELYAIADEANAIAEFDESNNTSHTTVSLLRVGDTNNDGVIDQTDVGPFVDVLLGLDSDPYHLASADMDGSGSVDGQDVQPFVQAILGI